jgi:hypothetical protein
MFFFCCFLDKKLLYNHFKNKFISMSLYLFFKSNYMFMFLKHVQWDLSISFDLKNIGFFSSWKFRFQVMDCVCFFKKISHENIYISQFSLSEKGRFPLQNGEITFTSICVSFLKMLQYFKACKSLETWLNDIF